MNTSHSEDNDRSAGAALARSVVFGALTGLVMGLAYFALLWFLQDWLRKTDLGTNFYGRYHMPYAHMPFALVSAIFAAIAAMLAKRISGAPRLLLLIPTSVTGAACLGVSWGLAKATITPWSERFSWIFLMVGACIVLGPLVGRRLR